MTESDWLEQITANPKDVSTQLAYADWLRDQHEDQLAHAWEWMARAGKYPRYQGWWHKTTVYGGNDHDDLPVGVFDALPVGVANGAHITWARFRTVADAVAALAVALARVSPPGGAGAGPRTAQTA